MRDVYGNWGPNMLMVFILAFIFSVGIGVATCLTGCEGTPDLPPCGPGTYENKGICLPIKTEPPCGTGTYEENGICVAYEKSEEVQCAEGTHPEGDTCIADPTPPPPPAKMIVCGKGTYFDLETYECVAKCNDVVPYYADGDNDGYGNASFIIAYHCPGQKINHQADNDDDCNDFDANINPGIPGTCPSTTPTECWADWDGDGYPSFHTPAGYIAVYTSDCPQGFAKRAQEDCDDMNSNIHPDATEICGDNKDNNCDGQVDEGCQKASIGTLHVSTSSDTPSAQQLIIGSSNVVLAKFKLTANTIEDVRVSEFIVGDGTQWNAANSLKNFRLYKDSTLLAFIPAIKKHPSGLALLIEFSGLNLLIPQGQSIVLTVRSDTTPYNDGGSVGSTHHLFVPKNGAPLNQNYVTVVGAKSNNPVDVDVVSGGQPIGKNMTLVRAKLSVAWAADSPSGSQIPADEQIIAKFIATNGSNVGNYSAYLKNMKIAVFCSGYPLKSFILRIYADSLAGGNLIASFDYIGFGTISGNRKWEFLLSGNFVKLEIPSGSSRNLIVTLETMKAGMETGDTLSVGINQGDVLWSDGVSDFNIVDSLPLQGRTLVY